MPSKSRKRDNNINSAGEGVEVETQHIRGRVGGPTTNASDILELSVTATPIESLNSTDTYYDVNNITIGNSTNSNNNHVHENSASDMVLTILGPILMFVLYVYSHRANVPSSQYHRGAMIRRQAERVWEIQRAKDERQAIPVETRRSQIRESLQKMKVVSKCAITGHCILEPVEEKENDGNNEVHEDNNETSSATDEEKSTKTNDLEHSAEQLQTSPKELEVVGNATSTDSEEDVPTPSSFSTDRVVTSSHSFTSSGENCPESPGTYERKPLLSSDSEDSMENFGSTKQTKEHSQSCSATTTNPITTYDGFDDDEDVCPICLDNFEVGDIVMFSRHNLCSCAHVFHEDCLMQWLLEQRENECPTCRARLIADPDTDATTTSSSSITDSDENSTSDLAEANGMLVDAEAIGDVEEGNGNKSDTIDKKDENTKGGDCGGDLDVTGDAQHKSVEKDDENELLETEKIDYIEGGFKYMIVKGSVKREPL